MYRAGTTPIMPMVVRWVGVVLAFCCATVRPCTCATSMFSVNCRPPRSITNRVGPLDFSTCVLTAANVDVGTPPTEMILSPAWRPADLAGAGAPGRHGALDSVLRFTLLTQLATLDTCGVSFVLTNPMVIDIRYRIRKPRMK